MDDWADKEAEEFRGLIEWIEEGYPLDCDLRAGEKKVLSEIATALRDVRKRALEEAAVTAEEKCGACIGELTGKECGIAEAIRGLGK